MFRSRLAPAAVAAAALVAAVIRWGLQGSGNLYTAFAKRFYVPDPDLGWRVSTRHPIWIGLDACAVIAVIAVVALVIRRRRSIAWGLAVVAAAVPVAAFASGGAPAGAKDTLPPRAAVLVESGIEGALAAPAGRYLVVKHAGTSITAHLSAGGEAFDARFERDIYGSLNINPSDLRWPIYADIGVASRAIDTGVGERTKHAREGYLHADKFPQITVEIAGVTAVRQVGPSDLAFRAPATVQLMGKSHHVEVSGTLVKPDAAALGRLGLAGDVLLVQADFALAIHETALAPAAGDFDGDRLPIHVSLVLEKP